MATSEVYQKGVLVERIDSDARTATTYNVDGTVASTRPATAEEIAFLTQADVDNTRAGNQATIASAAKSALAANATYLAIGTPTNAQVAAQVRALTQQNNKIIRVVLGVVLGDRSQLDATS